MTKAMNWELANRRKKALVRDASGDLPATIVAKHAGTCDVCHRGFRAGTKIRKAMTGWAHSWCDISGAQAVHDEMKARRDALRNQTA